jgi:hypothetical protein
MIKDCDSHARYQQIAICVQSFQQLECQFVLWPETRNGSWVERFRDAPFGQ